MTSLSPSEFAYFQLGMETLYDWQIEALEAFGIQEDGGKPVAVVAANGSGKTSNLVAPAILWFLNRYPKGQAIVTSGSFRQVEKQLWSAMRVFASLFPEWLFLQTEIKTQDGGFALGFSTDHAGRAEGWHPKEDENTDPVLIVVDEAKTVPNAIFEAFDRCTRRFQLWVSSPGSPSGEFFDSFHQNRGLFWTRRVTSFECPHIKADKRERDKLKYGERSPVYRSMHLAEFTEDEESLALSMTRLREALTIQCDPVEEGEKVAFFDFAAGRDENVFALRRGNSVRIIDAWRESDTVQAVRRFIGRARSEGLSGVHCWGDASGLGNPMIDLFADEGFRINPFYGGAPALDKDNYVSLNVEAWVQAIRMIERGKIHLGALDPMTFKQLTTRRLEWSSNGRLRLEDKEKMAKRGVKSPDRADALLGCIFCGAHLTGAITGGKAEASVLESTPFGVETLSF